MTRPKMNYNVKLSLLWTLFETASSSVRAGNILSIYIYLLSGTNTTVGVIQGINGVAQMIAALPAGMFADHHRRDTTLRLASLIGLAAGVSLTLSLLLKWPVWSLCVAMALMGLYRGVNSPPLESLFADSVPSGDARPFTLKYIIMLLASATGPVIAVAMFALDGDKWDAHTCANVVLAGTALMAVSLFAMWFFSDEASLPESEERSRRDALRAAASASNLLAYAALDGDDDVDAEGANVGGNPDVEDGKPPARVRCLPLCLPCCVPTCIFGNVALPRRCRWCADPTFVIPLLITISDLIGAFASGMTIKFFSLFFLNACGMLPVYLSIVNVVEPLIIAAFSQCVQKVMSERLGRLQTSMLTRIIDVVLLVCMAYLPAGEGHKRDVLVAVHLVRIGAANCTRPLMRSLMMDAAPRDQRGKWNALDSARAFSWSGSAALGGWLADVLGYQSTFLVTAVIKALSYVPLIFLLPLVPDGPVPPGFRPPRRPGHSEIDSQVVASVVDDDPPSDSMAATARQAGGPAGGELAPPPANGYGHTNGTHVQPREPATEGEQKQGEGLREPLLPKP